ncbi:MAG TPA: hypothetical protein RMH26_28715, partial [Polyangiaceae bacterium LLY-WYZ-15_(1-7)]|nr:hypothetical protein [Polyangiaceae bacterium LLY-WYZ-15_(1-7)]
MAGPATRAAARLDGPRFDLRFARGRARLALGRPLVQPGLRVERLGAEAELDGAVDVRRGAAAFRHRRMQLTELDAELRLEDALARGPAARRLRVEAFAGGAAEDDPLRVTLLVRDPIGVLGLELALAFDGPDLLLFPTALAALDAGPHGLAARVDAAARSFGLELDHALGALRWRRPVRRLLAEMLLPAGWRLPDERAAVFTLEARGRALRLRTDAAAGERGAARLQRARAAATPLDDELALLDLEAVPPGEEG